MAKRLFLLLFSAFVGISGSPEILMASDSFTLTGLDNAGITETVPLPEPEPEPEPAPVYVAPAPVHVAPQIVNYTVSFYIGSAKEYGETFQNLSYNGLYKFRRMIYGHNSWNLLGNLANRYVGEIFTITEGGVARNYQVMAKQVYEKTGVSSLNNDPGLMTNIATTALGYDVALLTCYGTSYGNGDASHRLVIFANAI